MLYSMTGFGRTEATVSGRQIVVEIKSLNGKNLELSTRIAPLLRPYETEVRSIAANVLLRGSIDLSVVVKQDGAARPMSVNTDLALAYYRSMQSIAQAAGIAEDNALSTIMRMPEVISQDADVMQPEEWSSVRSLITDAAAALMQHRATEGAALAADLRLRMDNIIALNEAVAPLDASRTERMRMKLRAGLKDAAINTADENRFEQELVYYLEKMDFSEERTRLTQHCTYFYEVMANTHEIARGKKLGFILQEVGREINTLGSKAADAAIQKLIVQMKDELEKAKEQVLNVL